MPTVNPSILQSLTRLRLMQPLQPGPLSASRIRPDVLQNMLGAHGPIVPTSQQFAPMSAQFAQPRDLSLSASGSGETLVIVLAAAAAGLGLAYATGSWPFKGRRSRKHAR